MQAEVSTATGSTKHPGSTLKGLWGLQDRTWRSLSTPLALSDVILSVWVLHAGREQSIALQDSPFRRCLGLWNNRWCFYNLSEACSWVDGERQYLRTTRLQEVVKLLLPIYFFDNAFTEECFLFILFLILFLFYCHGNQSVFFFFFFYPSSSLSSSPFHVDLSNCKSYFKLTWRH